MLDKVAQRRRVAALEEHQVGKGHVGEYEGQAESFWIARRGVSAILRDKCASKLIIASSRYIVYDADDVDFWLGLKADLDREESELSWESVLLNRWPNLKAVIAKIQTVTVDGECPIHQVWISSRNAINLDDPPKDNPLDRVSRLVYGSPLSVMAKSTTVSKENDPRFKTNIEIARRALPVKSSTVSGPGSGDSPFFSPSEAARITDDQLFGFDFYVPSDVLELNIYPTWGKADPIAFLFCLARDALPSEKWSMDIACADALQVIYWFFAVSFFG
jgi:hypothetical protein